MPRRSSTLLIFAVAAVARFVIAFLQLIHGIQNMNWLQLISWSDFYQIYGNQLASLSHGLLPYLNFGYWYTPLFLYTLYLFYLFGGIHLASVPMLLADTAMAPLIYLIVLMRSNERVATIAGLLYALFPVALFVEGYLWLSSEPMAFFLLLTIYWMYKGKPILSSVSLAFSILFKQEALFILPAFVFWYFVKYRTKSWKGIALLICILFVVSAPFLIISPVGYLNGVTSGSLGVVYSGPNFLRSTMTLPSPTSATTQACTQILASTLNSSQIVCGLTYSWGKPSPGYLLVTMLEWVVYLAVFPIFVLTAFLLFLSRKRNNILELSCALSLIGFLLLFSLSVHSLLVYYFIPVYALLFASARGRSTLSVLIITSILSVFTPDKSYVPALLTLLSLTAIILVDKQGVTGTVPKVLKESGTGENNGTTEHSSVAIVRR